MQGVYTRCPDRVEALANAPGPTRLDDLPYPQFDDYFEELRTVALPLPRRPYLSLETSRGCWWGQKHHCTFCSINGAAMSYVSKSGKRVVDEMRYFAGKYPGAEFVMTDSILNPRYFKDVFPVLADCGLDLDIQYEMRAMLRKNQLELLRRCGVKLIQPGIESLSTEVLNLMRKRTNLLYNVRLLKWCKEIGITVYWNLLYGFPDEPTEAYDEMAKLIPKITHLDPPKMVRIIEIGRNSPLFDEASELGIVNLQPSPAYRYLYPLSDQQIRELATYFTYDYEKPRDIFWYAASVVREAGTWRNDAGKSNLSIVHEPDRSVVFDERVGFEARRHVFTGLEHQLLMECDDVRRIDALTDKYNMASSFERALGTLEQHGLLIRDNERCLGLAVRAQAMRAAEIRDGVPRCQRVAALEAIG